MAVHLTKDGGIPHAAEYPLLTPSSEFRFGENYGFWCFSDDGSLAVHVHLETVDPDVVRHSPAMIGLRREFSMVQCNTTGEVAHDWSTGWRSTVRGCGGVYSASECLEPFSLWSLSYRGAPYRSMSADMLAAKVEDRTLRQMAVEYDLELSVAAPPWIQGGIGKDPVSMMSTDTGRLLGGFRYEQLVTVQGTVSLDGKRRDFRGTGVRTHRRGDRNLANLNGHVWLTGLFPSGRGFGLQSLFEPDGTIVFEEAMVTDGDRIAKATILEISRLNHLQPGNEEVGFVLDSDFGRMEVLGRNAHAVSARTILKGPYEGKTERWGLDRRIPRNLILTQSGAQWSWRGEVGYGLNERSAEFEQIAGVDGSSSTPRRMA